MWLIIYITSLLLAFPQQVIAEQNVVINEFSIEPEQKIELWNNSSETIDISHWYLDDNGGITYFTIPANTFLYSNSCIVFTDSFNLNKSSADTVRLFDNLAPPTTTSAQLIDNFSYSRSPGMNVAWLRLPDGGTVWATGSASFGLLNQLGTPCVITPTQTPTPTTSRISETPSVTEGPSIRPAIPTPIISGCILLSEIMPYPLSTDTEWVELYNSCSDDVALRDWLIDDIPDGGSTPKQFSLVVEAQSFATVEVITAILNNAGDNVRLLDNTGSLVDTTEYSEATQGQTFSRQSFTTGAGWCKTPPSKGTSNAVCDHVTAQPIPHPEPIVTVPALSPVLPSSSPLKQFKKYFPINFVINAIPTPKTNILGISTKRKIQAPSSEITYLFALFIITTLSSLGAFVTIAVVSSHNYLQ